VLWNKSMDEGGARNPFDSRDSVTIVTHIFKSS